MPAAIGQSQTTRGVAPPDSGSTTATREAASPISRARANAGATIDASTPVVPSHLAPLALPAALTGLPASRTRARSRQLICNALDIGGNVAVTVSTVGIAASLGDALFNGSAGNDARALVVESAVFAGLFGSGLSMWTASTRLQENTPDTRERTTPPETPDNTARAALAASEPGSENISPSTTQESPGTAVPFDIENPPPLR